MNPKPAPREHLVRAGAELLAHVDSAVLARSLSIAAVVDEAGLSHQTFHNAFPGSSRGAQKAGKEAFVDDVIRHFALDYRTLADGRPGPEPTPVVSSLFDTMMSGQMRRRLIAALLALDHDGTRDAVVPDLARMDDDVDTALRSSLTTVGGSLRHPTDVPTLAVLATALADGLALREILSPGTVTDAVLTAASHMLFYGAVDPEHSGRTEGTTDPTFELDPTRTDIEADIIGATTELFERSGYFRVTMSDIADASRVSLAHLTRLFPSKVDVIVAALKPDFDRLVRLQRADEKLGLDVRSALRRSLVAVGEFLVQNRAMTSSMLLALSFEQIYQPSTVTTIVRELHVPSTVTTIVRELHVPSVVTPIVERGQSDGIFGTDSPAGDIAAMLTNNVVFRCLTRRDESPDTVADGVLRILMPGVDGR